MSSFNSCHENMRRFVCSSRALVKKRKTSVSQMKKEPVVEISTASFHGSNSERQAFALQGTEVEIRSCLWSFL